MERRDSARELRTIADVAREKCRVVESEESLVLKDIENFQLDGDPLHLLRAIARLQDMLASTAQLTEHATLMSARMIHQTRGTLQTRSSQAPLGPTQHPVGMASHLGHRAPHHPHPFLESPPPAAISSHLSHEALHALGLGAHAPHTLAPNIAPGLAATHPPVQPHTAAAQSLLGAIRRQTQKTSESYRRAIVGLEETSLIAEEVIQILQEHPAAFVHVPLL